MARPKVRLEEARFYGLPNFYLWLRLRPGVIRTDNTTVKNVQTLLGGFLQHPSLWKDFYLELDGDGIVRMVMGVSTLLLDFDV